jgi:hypothetical protein
MTPPAVNPAARRLSKLSFPKGRAAHPALGRPSPIPVRSANVWQPMRHKLLRLEKSHRQRDSRVDEAKSEKLAEDVRSRHRTSCIAHSKPRSGQHKSSAKGLSHVGGREGRIIPKDKVTGLHERHSPGGVGDHPPCDVVLREKNIARVTGIPKT